MTREDEIFEKLKKGDPDAAGELARLYYDDILRYCLFHVPDRSLAQDAVQETFLKVPPFRQLQTQRTFPGLSLPGGRQCVCGYLQKEALGARD